MKNILDRGSVFNKSNTRANLQGERSSKMKIRPEKVGITVQACMLLEFPCFPTFKY